MINDQTDRPETAQQPSWRDLAGLMADLRFETDAAGHFTALEPETVLGWQAEELIGQPSTRLLADPSGFDPFRPQAAIRRRVVALRTGAGGTVNGQMTSAPAMDSTGQRVGARGVIIDMSRQDARDLAAAGEKRRADTVLRILDQMRGESQPARRIAALLESLASAIGAESVAIVELMGRMPPVVRQRVGGEDNAALLAALHTLNMDDPDPGIGHAPDGRAVIACPAITRFGEKVAVAGWRAVGQPDWTESEMQILRGVSAIAGTVLEHDAIQREMTRQLRNDPLTGLFNRRAFLEEATRRIDRLDREGMTGTLMLVRLDDYLGLGQLGPDISDESLLIMARLLRAALRPADLVARLGGGSFGCWMDGADELTGAERAERLRLQVPRELAQIPAVSGLKLTIAIGIANRRPGRGEDLESLLRRAGQALDEARHDGWRVSHAEPN